MAAKYWGGLGSLVRWLSFLLYALLSALLPSLAQARNAAQLTTPCPGNAGERLPASVAEKSALAIGLEVLQETCQNDAGYLAWYGALLNALGRTAEAALLLERALLLNPDHAGAHADYAEALATLGDRTAARNLFSELLRRPDLPSHLGDPFRQRVSALEDAPWLLAGSVTLRRTHESNLNSAPANDRLVLTLPEGDAILDLDRSARARSGAASVLELSGDARRAISAGARISLSAELKTRAEGPSAKQYTQADALVQLGLASGQGEWLIEGGLGRFDYAGARLFQAMRGSLARQWPLAGCQHRLGVEFEARHYPTNALLDGQYRALAAGSRCVLGEQFISLSLRHGEDAPVESDRPGGMQKRADLRAQYAKPLARGLVQTEIQLSRQADTDSYSQLLSHGAIRRINRATLRFEYAYPLGNRWDIVANYEITRQDSNIALFDIGNRAIGIGVRWRGK